MISGLYSTDFPEVFSKILEKSGVTCYQIQKFTDLDQGYLSRLKNGSKGNPSPETIVKISLGLVHSSEKVTLSDIEDLFQSAGRSLHK